ncbi:hypothetical protein PspLS_10381 [Pyricularia sp. CBS 133598]|nr:hypothetical protein PspLS_10381 [Pyricularia sp. CBS 133598]
MKPHHRSRSGEPEPHSYSLLFIALLATSPTLASAQKITGGPAATVSLYKQTDYSTARACAVGCLVYNGIYHCGVNAGYQDLGIGLGCGCGSVNGCYCNTKVAAEASSYVSSCVSSRCAANVGDWKSEIGSMMNMYGTYCATANVEPTPNAANAPNPAGVTGKAASGTLQTSAGGGSRAGAGLPAETGDSGAGQQQQQQSNGGGDSASKGGLSQSDVIALAASLGVGVPSLMIAAATLWLQMKKKKSKALAASTAAKPPSVQGGNTSLAC